MEKAERKQVEKYARSLKWTPEDYYWQHTLQVRKFALMMQRKVGGNRDAIEIAALLHDVGKAKLLAPGHEQISAQLAEELLKKLGFDEQLIQRVTGCIRYQNFESLESKILRSADSMSLIMDDSGGREWYFESFLKNDSGHIRAELQKSYSEIEFDFAKKLVEKTYDRLISKYT